MKVILWNSSKLASAQSVNNNPNLYSSLVDYEKTSGCSISSIIYVSDCEELNRIINAVEYETDVKLCYQITGCEND